MINTFDLKNIIDDEPDFIPLLSHEEEEQMNTEPMPEVLPILPLRNTVLFPGMVIPITVGRDRSIKLIKDSYKSDKRIGVVAQKDVNVEDPGLGDLFSKGTVAHILKMLRMPDGNTTVIIQGKKRFEIKELVQEEPYLRANVTAFVDEPIPNIKEDKEMKALYSSLKDMALQIIQNSPNIPSEAAFAINNIESPAFLLNFISSNMNTPVEEKQKLLELTNIKERATVVLQHLNKELQMLELKNQIQSKVKMDIDKQQREYFLNQQLKTIQEELGGNSHDIEIKQLREKALQKKWNEPVQLAFNKEIEKLGRMNPAAAEYSVTMNYLELLLDLPWNEFTKDKFDLKKAQKVLDKDHYGLEKVKARILEYLAVLKLKGDLKSPILCLYGPPGVGKTSLGKSIAKALGRKYIRVSLGGVHDEAEIRGHRKTYIGAMPGRIIQNIKKVKSSNPVLVLDEIDKIGMSSHGDPSSALLEVLDPEQNNTFYDNYVELDYDLSKVLFIATANSLSTIQPALRDRMEIIEINGYTVEEKMHIAVDHLIPKLLENHGIKKNQFALNASVLEKVIEQYTGESGVRNLEKKLASLIRGVAKYIAMDESYNVKLTFDDVVKILGAPIYRKDRYLNNDVAGVVTGLAWTAVGGEILIIESSVNPGSGKLTLTGNLGEVMKESAIIAMAYLKAHSHQLNIDHRIFDSWDIHIHFPEGAVPKDGPSAGVTILSALTSLLTQKKIKAGLAMTGEITLRGKVLPVGGIQEKILAAKRSGIKDVILCQDNKKDVDEIKKDYLGTLNIHYVNTMDEVLKIAISDESVAKPVNFAANLKPKVEKMDSAVEINQTV